MNAVEIEDAVSKLFETSFEPNEFPYQFLEAYGNKSTTIKRLRTGNMNRSDVSGAVLQYNNIHFAVAAKDQVKEKLDELRASAATHKQKAKYILATDGVWIEAEALFADAATVACEYNDFPDHFGFFLPLAGITTVKQISENSFDIRATSRLNKLYVELLKINPEWGSPTKRQEMNHFMSRLVFCFFAEDTDIFTKLNYLGNHSAAIGSATFTNTVDELSERDGSNTHEVIAQIFKTMDIQIQDREKHQIPRWARSFPYVNGHLFSGEIEVPVFNKLARSYLVHIGSLDWTQVNPDIFGSMIQAVTDDEEREALGMHYTSVPNILKLLNPLFLDSLRNQLEIAGDSPQKLLNLRKRLSKIRVFDPACGSGNFLVIAYKEMRQIEATINRLRNEPDRRSDILLTNFHGIEIRHFSSEIARLALIIAEYQCDVMYRGQQEALAEFLPLSKENWIVCGNALSIDWQEVCPPVTKLAGTSEKKITLEANAETTDVSSQEIETYICGNPPFKGSRKQSQQEKDDLEQVFAGLTTKWKNVDYVGAWLMKAAQYNKACKAPFAFVSTNSLCQGQQVPITWALLQEQGFRIRFAHTSFKWSNLAANKAGVTVVITGVDQVKDGKRWIYTGDNKREVTNINPYLTEHYIDYIAALKKPRYTNIAMEYGVYYSKSEGLLLDLQTKDKLNKIGFPSNMVRRFLGSSEFINGKERYCLWIGDDEVGDAEKFEIVRQRIESVRKDRLETDDKAVNKLAAKPYQFRERKGDEAKKIFIPIVSSENREYFPAGLADSNVIPTNKAFYIPDGALYTLAIIVSKLHLAWIGAVCGKLELRYSYSNTLGWNTFPIPNLTEKNKADLARSAEDILLARETHFPATIADLYEPDNMPENLRHAHDRNDEILERIYLGRRFKSDTERLERLFDMYTKTIASENDRKGIR